LDLLDELRSLSERRKVLPAVASDEGNAALLADSLLGVLLVFRAEA
jgi:hypothetical protein